MDDFMTSYFGYATYEELHQKRLASLSGAGYFQERKELPNKEEYDADILANIERHCTIVISEVNFCQGSARPVRRQWRWENPVVFAHLPVEIQEWIRTKTIPMQPIYS